MDNPIRQIARARKPGNTKSDRTDHQLKLPPKKKNWNKFEVKIKHVISEYAYCCWGFFIIIIVILHPVLCSLELSLLFYCHNWPQSVFFVVVVKKKNKQTKNTLFKPLPFLSHSFKNKTRKTKPYTCDLYQFSQALFQTFSYYKPFSHMFISSILTSLSGRRFHPYAWNNSPLVLCASYQFTTLLASALTEHLCCSSPQYCIGLLESLKKLEKELYALEIEWTEGGYEIYQAVMTCLIYWYWKFNPVHGGM